MANGPLGGFMPTPAAPAQPPSVKLDTTAVSRGNFNTFLKNMNGATSLNPPSMAPSVGAPTPLMAPTMSNIDIFNPDMQMMREGGNVAPRQTEIMGQPHMLAYITPQEGQLLEGLGGANMPGPMGIPSFFGPDGPGDDGTDPSDTGPSESNGNGDTGPGEFSDTDALGGFSDSNVDDSAPDDDIDYTDVDYGYTTVSGPPGPGGPQDDFGRATAIGQAVAAAQAAQAAQDAQRDRALDAIKSQQALAATRSNLSKAQQQQSVNVDKSTGQPSFSSAMTGRGGTTGVAPSGVAASIAPSIGTAQTNISKDIEDLDLSLDLDPFGGPGGGKSTQSTAGDQSKSGDMPSGSMSITNPVTGQTTTYSPTTVPDLEKAGPIVGDIFGMRNKINSIIEKRDKQGLYTEVTRDSKGNITGAFDTGPMFGTFGPEVTTYTGIDTSVTDDDLGGGENDNILQRPTTPKKDEEEEKTNIGALGAANPFVQGQSPVLVESPFTTNVGDFRGTGFDAGDLNALIAQITRQNLPTAMAKGGIAGFANGGLIKAVDDFLATGT